MNTPFFLRQSNINFYGNRNSRKNKHWGKEVRRGGAGSAWMQVVMYSVHTGVVDTSLQLPILGYSETEVSASRKGK